MISEAKIAVGILLIETLKMEGYLDRNKYWAEVQKQDSKPPKMLFEKVPNTTSSSFQDYL